MTRRPIQMTRQEFAKAVDPSKLAPGSPLLAVRSRKKREHPEHDAQVRLFEMIDDADDPIVDCWSQAIHAIPQFVGADESWRSKKHGDRYKSEGQRPGMPDVHVPVLRYALRVASLYVELKYEAYPSENQRIMFPLLAEAGNAVVVIRCPDVDKLARLAYETIASYLHAEPNFYRHGHPKHIYLPGDR